MTNADTVNGYSESTRSVCPKCLATIDARVVVRDGRVIMQKRCPEHGPFESLLSSDARMYIESLPFNKPGRLPLKFSTAATKGCPEDCGLCPEHTQHTCVALIEITSRCNLECPVCFADSRPGFDLTLGQVEGMLDRFVQLEGKPEVVQFSGGEPTVHPDLIAMIHAANEKGIGMVMLNTNGLRIAEDDAFLARLADVRPTVYLQFDGFSNGSQEKLRGRNLVATKLKALDRLVQAKLDVVLVPTVDKHANHDQLGEIVKFGLKHPAVHGIAFQPVTHGGRYEHAWDPLDRETIPDVIHGIAQQTGGLLVESDFIPVPCCHPTCRSATYIYLDGDKATPLPRMVEVDKYLNYVVNRTLPEIKPEILEALEGLWSAASVPGRPSTVSRFLSACCELPFINKSALLKRHVFTIVIQDFADAYTMDLDVLHKCCVGQLIPDGRMIPFCAYNSLGYRQKVFSALCPAAA